MGCSVINGKLIIKFLLCFILLATTYSIAQSGLSSKFNSVQVDTSDFFPLTNGDYWEYRADNSYGSEYIFLKVIGDTLLPNGKLYKYFLETSTYSSPQEYYFRKDSFNVVRYFGDTIDCIDREYKYFDFYLPDSAIWEVCRDLGPCGNARGIAETYFDYTHYNFFGKPLETKRFEDVLTDSIDTLWVPCESRVYWLSKAIGITRIFYFNVGDFELTGALVEGQQFGTLVSIENKYDNLPKKSMLYQNYPNPFNPVTTIKYSIPSVGISPAYLPRLRLVGAGRTGRFMKFVQLKVYNILGEEVATLVNEQQPAGTYEVKFDGSSLPGGVYVYRLTAGEFRSVKKMTLIK